MLRVGWFSTGRGEGSRGLLRFVADAIAAGNLDAQIDFVFSNREPGEADGSDEFFDLVGSYGLPLVTNSSARYRRENGGGPMSRHRVGFDRKVMESLASFQPDVCVLAGYMLICSGELCRKYPLLNLHGALPDGPTGTWQSVIWELIESKATRTGAMIHMATEEVDRGPVLSHCELPIVGGRFDDEWRKLDGLNIERVRSEQGEANGLFRLIRSEGYRREPHLLLETIRAVSQGRIRVRPGEALDTHGQPLGRSHAAGLPLTQEIEAALGAEKG